MQDPLLQEGKKAMFFESNRTFRIFIYILAFALFFVVLHFKEVPVISLELDSKAPSYVVAQVDFDFFDEEATILQKQEATRDIGKIFRLPSKELRQERLSVENALLAKEGANDYAHIYPLTESLEQFLGNLRFTDPRTYQRLQKTPLSRPYFFVVFLPEEGQKTVLPWTAWQHLETVLGKEEFGKEALALLRKVEWNFNEDVILEKEVRKVIQAQVPNKYTRVHAGDRIIDQGEKVTSRHLAELHSMKRALGDKRNLSHPATVAGTLFLTLLFFSLFFGYLKFQDPHVFSSNRKLLLLVVVLGLTLVFSKGVEILLLSSRSNLFEAARFPIFVPFAGILIAYLLKPDLAIFSTAVLTVLLTIALPFQHERFLTLNLVAGMTAVFSMRSLKKRKDVFIICLKAWAAAAVVVLAFDLADGACLTTLAVDLLTTFAAMMVTAVLVVGFLPAFETSFEIMTDVTLLEYMDPSNPLLRRLATEAPGTYQHSVVVANLSEAAALAIGANSLFCRAASLYHDVGKTNAPQYFTENQQVGVNVHQLLTPRESAAVIIDHVQEGVTLARKAGLPEPFIDVIKEHHGTTLVYYFYRKQIEKFGAEPELVEEKEFRYSGPKPKSKEATIIMIADSMEAASRTLEDVNEENLRHLINRLVKDKADDNQFERSWLTLEELETVKDVLIKTLLAFTHARIKYPQKIIPPSSEEIVDS